MTWVQFWIAVACGSLIGMFVAMISILSGWQ